MVAKKILNSLLKQSSKLSGTIKWYMYYAISYKNYNIFPISISTRPMESQTVWYQCCVFTMQQQGMSTKEAIRDQVPLLYTWNHGIVTSLISWTWGRTREKKNRYRKRSILLFTSLNDIHGVPCYKLKLFKNMAVCAIKVLVGHGDLKMALLWL